MVLPKVGSFRWWNQPKNERTQAKTVSEIRTEHNNALNSGSYHQNSKQNAQQPAAQYTSTLTNGRPTTPTARRMKQYERINDNASRSINNSDSTRTLTTRSNNNSNSNRTLATRSSMTLEVQNSPTSRNNIGSSKVQLDEKPPPELPNLNLSGGSNRNLQQFNFPNNAQQQKPRMIRKVILFLTMKAKDVERVDAAIQGQYQHQQQWQQQQQQQQHGPKVNVHDITETTQEDSFSTTSNHINSQHVVSALKQQQTLSPKTDEFSTSKQLSSNLNSEKTTSTKQLQAPSPNQDKERRLKSTNDLLLGSKSSSSREITKDSPTQEMKASKSIVGLRPTLIEEELKQCLETHNTDVEDKDPNSTDDTEDQFITTDDTDEDNRNKNYDEDFYDSNHNPTHSTTDNEVDQDDDDSLNMSHNNTLESEYDRVVDGIDTTATYDHADFDSSYYHDDDYEEDGDDRDSNNTTDASEFDDDDDDAGDGDDDDEDELNGKAYDPLAPLDDFPDLFPDYIPWGRGPGSVVSSSKPGKTKRTTTTRSTRTMSNRKHTKRSSASSTCSMSVRTSNSNVTVASYIKEKNNPFSRHYIEPSEQSPSVRRKNLAARAAMTATIKQQQKQQQKQKKLNKKKLAKCNTVANSSTSSTNRKVKDPVTGYRSTKAKNKMFIPRKIEVERFIIQAPAASTPEPTATITNTTVTSTTATTVTPCNHSTNRDTVPVGIPLSEPLPTPRSNIDAPLDRHIPRSALHRHPYDRDTQDHRHELDHHTRYQEPPPENGASAYLENDPYFPHGRKTPSNHQHGRISPFSHHYHPSNDQHPPHDHRYHYHHNHDDLRYDRRRNEYDRDDYYLRHEPNHYDEPHHHPHPSFGHQYQKYVDDFHRPATPTNLRPSTPVNGPARVTPINFNLRAPSPVDRFHSSRTPTPYGPSTCDDHYSPSAASVSGANKSYSSRQSHYHYSQPRDPTYDGSYLQNRSSYSTATNDSERGSRSHFYHLHTHMSDYDREGHSDQHGYEHQRGGNYQHSVSNSLVVYNGSPEANYYYDDGNQRSARHTKSHQVVRDEQYNARNEQRLWSVGTIPEGQPYNNHYFHQSNRSLDTGLRQNNNRHFNHEFARTTHDGRSANYPHHCRDNSSEDFQSGFRNNDGVHNAQRRELRPPYPSKTQPNDHHDYREKYLSSNLSSMNKDNMYSGRNESSYSGNYIESVDPLSLEDPCSRVVSPIHFSCFQGRETPTDRSTIQKSGSRWDELDAKYQNNPTMDSKNSKVPTSPRYKEYPYDGDGVSSKTNQHHSKSYTDNASATNSKKLPFSYPPALQTLNDPREVKNQQDLGAHSATAYHQQQTHVHSRIDDKPLFFSMGASERRLNFDSNRLLLDKNTKTPPGPSPCLPESDCEADDVTVNTQNTGNFDSLAQDLGPDSMESQRGYSRRLYFPSQTSSKSDQSSITMSGHHPQTRGTNSSLVPTKNDLTPSSVTAKGLTDPPRGDGIALDPDTLLQNSDNSRDSENLSTISTTQSQFRQQQSGTPDNVASAYRNSVLDNYPVISTNARRQPHQNSHSNSLGADGTDQQQPSPQHIEICEGVYGVLRDANETIQAYEDGLIAYPVCLVCSLDLVSMADAEYVSCPSCKVVSPVVVHESSREGRRPGGGVCLGLDASRCR